MTIAKFSSTEWKQLINAPQLIYHLLSATDSRVFFTKRIEARALNDFLGSYHTESALVQSIIAGQKEADHEVEASGEETLKMLERVGAMLEAKLDVVEGDAVRDFLVKSGEAIAQASTEHLLKTGDRVSEAERKSLDALAIALKATDADKRRRYEAGVAAEAKKQTEEEEKAKKEPEEEDKAKKPAGTPKREPDSTKDAGQTAAKEAETIYVVKKGDTLSGIALEVYGNAGRWREIFANRDIIKKANLIRPGWKLYPTLAL